MNRSAFLPNVILGCLLMGGIAEAQKIEMGAPATASSSEHGVYIWYQTLVDPDDAGNMIICGAGWNAKDSAPYGFVYYSGDGGRRWTLALQDTNSTWVTEQSCAYGVHGVAYFVSDSSKVIDGFPHHDLGTTRIYVSRDAGKTWKVGIKTGWTDASSSVVDTIPGPNQNRLYVFFTGRQMISYKDGDAQVQAPVAISEKTNAAFADPSFLLKDGSILAFYFMNRKSGAGANRFTMEAVRTSLDRSKLESPVTITEFPEDNSEDSTTSYSRDCDFYLNAAGTYDEVRNKLYLIYPLEHDKTCHLFLTTSSDGGRSWTKAQSVRSPDETPVSTYAHPAIAVNQEGVLAVMWEQKERSGCWMFAVSEDGGLSLSRGRPLGTCGRQQMASGVLSTAYLWTQVVQAGAPGGGSDAAKILIANLRNAVQRDGRAIGVTPDGIFHPVWVDAGNGKGEMRVVAIRVKSAEALIESERKGFVDVTAKVAVLYGGNQYYSAESGTLTVDIAIQNKSTEPIHGPFRLISPHFFEDYGHSEIVNAANDIASAGAAWDLSATIPGGTLYPGHTSKPFSLKFHYLPDGDYDSPLRDDILEFTVKVFASSHAVQESR